MRTVVCAMCISISFPHFHPCYIEAIGSDWCAPVVICVWSVFLNSVSQFKFYVDKYTLLDHSFTLGEKKMRAGTLSQDEAIECSKTDSAVDIQEIPQSPNTSPLKHSPDSSDLVSYDSHDCLQNSQEKQVVEELDEAAIIKNHLDPVPFPEPHFNPTPSFHYILWNHNESPIKVFKETPV